LRELLRKGCEKWCQIPEVVYLCLSIAIGMDSGNKEELKKLFERAIKRLDSKAIETDKKRTRIDDLLEEEEEEEEETEKESPKSVFHIMMLYVEWASKHLLPKEVVNIVKKYSEVNATSFSDLTSARESATHFKPLLLEKAAVLLDQGVLKARVYYKKLANHHPIIPQFIRKMIDIELCQDNEYYDYDYAESLFLEYVTKFGEDSHVPWIEYITFELNRGQTEKVGDIYYKATKNLEPRECDSFVAKYSLFNK
jgi:hypothetical protein